MVRRQLLGAVGARELHHEQVIGNRGALSRRDGPSDDHVVLRIDRHRHAFRDLVHHVLPDDGAVGGLTFTTIRCRGPVST
mgnify:CR=1 FL=1